MCIQNTCIVPKFMVLGELMTDFLVHPSLELKPNLEFLYQQWLISQKILTEVHSLCGELPLGKVKAGLENALMRRVLDLVEPNPMDLFRCLDVDGLGFGFYCVGLDFDRSVLESMFVVIQRSVETIHEVPLPEIYVEETKILFGTFVLVRNVPVNRLLDVTTRQMDFSLAVSHVLCSALQYNALYAETRHIGPPQCVYDDFHSWGVRNEGFASPFNARLLGKEHAGFFSAFPHTDAIFGSRGSFFHADWKDFDGAWCVDPPFLEETLSRVDAIVGRWRTEGCPPVLYIGPSSYEMKTPFDEEIRLLKGTHFYEGLDGQLHPLPMDVSIWRFGEIEGFDVDRIVSGYLPIQSSK